MSHSRGPSWSVRRSVAPHLRDLRPRAKSLIIMVYGGAIPPHGGATWLGDLGFGNLISLLSGFAMAERIIPPPSAAASASCS